MDGRHDENCTDYSCDFCMAWVRNYFPALSKKKSRSAGRRRGFDPRAHAWWINPNPPSDTLSEADQLPEITGNLERFSNGLHRANIEQQNEARGRDVNHRPTMTEWLSFSPYFIPIEGEGNGYQLNLQPHFFMPGFDSRDYDGVDQRPRPISGEQLRDFLERWHGHRGMEVCIQMRETWAARMDRHNPLSDHIEFSIPRDEEELDYLALHEEKANQTLEAALHKKISKPMQNAFSLLMEIIEASQGNIRIEGTKIIIKGRSGLHWELSCKKGGLPTVNNIELHRHFCIQPDINMRTEVPSMDWVVTYCLTLSDDIASSMSGEIHTLSYGLRQEVREAMRMGFIPSKDFDIDNINSAPPHDFRPRNRNALIHRMNWNQEGDDDNRFRRMIDSIEPTMRETTRDSIK